MSQRIYILNQFLWPDGAPTALYAEQLADRLSSCGHIVRLVGGHGIYRPTGRPPPCTPIERIAHHSGARHRLWSAAAEYLSVVRGFKEYLEARLAPGDVVIATSAPPTTLGLWRTIRRCDATSVYWLQDYYPELLRTLMPIPARMRRAMRRVYDGQLLRWDRVVKIASTLGYRGSNSTTIRNWPTMEFPDHLSPKEKTALYAGNLGYGHHIPSLVRACEQLRDQGFTITIRADGPGVGKLPEWLVPAPLFERPDDLVRAYQEAEIHVVAAHPEVQEAFFPSKIWNGLAAGRQVLCTGFGPLMADEFQRSVESDFRRHLDLWVALIGELKEMSPASGRGSCAA